MLIYHAPSRRCVSLPRESFVFNFSISLSVAIVNLVQQKYRVCACLETIKTD